MKKQLILALALMMGFQAASCQKSIVILYENDVHCGIDGYKKMAGLRDAINRSELRRRDIERLIKFNDKASGFTFVSGTAMMLRCWAKTLAVMVKNNVSSQYLVFLFISFRFKRYLMNTFLPFTM